MLDLATSAVREAAMERNHQLGRAGGLDLPLTDDGGLCAGRKERPHRSHDTFAGCDPASSRLASRKDHEVRIELQIRQLPGFEQAVFTRRRTAGRKNDAGVERTVLLEKTMAGHVNDPVTGRFHLEAILRRLAAKVNRTAVRTVECPELPHLPFGFRQRRQIRRQDRRPRDLRTEVCLAHRQKRGRAVSSRWIDQDFAQYGQRRRVGNRRGFDDVTARVVLKGLERRLPEGAVGNDDETCLSGQETSGRRQ